jgi:hypothetical protein
MAIKAAKMVGRVRSPKPVTSLFTSRVATQAYAIRFLRRAIAELHDLGDVAAPLGVQASRTVTILAFHTLLRVECVAEVLGNCFVTARAGIRADRLGSRNLRVLCVRRDVVG